MYELYTGLRAPEGFQGLHVPFIKVLPISNAPQNFDDATHLIITSRTTLEILKKTPKVPHFCVGKKTASLLPKDYEIYVPQVETAEGVVEMLREYKLGEDATVYWPRSSSARSCISEFFETIDAKLEVINLYDTVAIVPEEVPEIERVTKVIFTSPTTVHSFFSIYKARDLPAFETIGGVTQATLDSYLAKQAQ